MTPKCSSLIALIALSLITSLTAQARPAAPATEAEVDRIAVQVLLGVARAAETSKDGPRAKAVYERILDDHELENQVARTALGYRKQQGGWQPARSRASTTRWRRRIGRGSTMRGV
ncbi:MAG: hypothetical protein IPK26_20750 [Planctomycetes bacterium]|nr:hypothetical protein [Planctomycetota bacterium]